VPTFYGHKWRKRRLAFLAQNPLCVMCKREGRITAADTVDHIKPHKGDLKLFWDKAGNWQALCSSCHSQKKQREEIHGHSNEVDLSGWPVDPRHPVNKKK
jgi:5-methylcytosine-specific restriction protein A